MTRWLLLTGAVVAEVIGTLTLRAAVDDPGWIPVIVVSYAVAFLLLGLTLRTGMALGAVYGTWAAMGVALVALLGMVVFGETPSALTLLGIGVIIIGVVLVETGSHREGGSAAEQVRR